MLITLTKALRSIIDGIDLPPNAFIGYCFARILALRLSGGIEIKRSLKHLTWIFGKSLCICILTGGPLKHLARSFGKVLVDEHHWYLHHIAAAKSYIVKSLDTVQWTGKLLRI